MSQRILQICHDYHGPFVSICRQYVDVFPGAEVTTVFVQGEHTSFVVDGVGGKSVLFLAQANENLRGFKLSQILRLQRLLGNQQFDLVIAHRYKGIYLAGILSYFRHFPKVLGIAHEHDVFKRITRKLFVTFWRRRIIVAGVSDTVVRNIAERCPSLVTQNRLHVLPNVLPEDFSDRLLSKQEAQRELGIDPSEFIIGTIGRLVKKKSLAVLIAAFAELDHKVLNMRLVLIGDGPLRDELEAQARTLDVARKITFQGHVENAGHHVAAFDLFVLASGDAEAFGLVLLEAMMARVPVLTSQAEGPAEVVSDRSLQFLTDDEKDLARKIDELLTKPEADKQRLVEKNHARVLASFSLSKFRETLNNLL